METLEKKEYLNRLFDLYKPLLTKKQTETFIYYYVEDYSLQEIADIFQVSRNAIFDQLKKVEQHLNDYENKLRLYQKQEAREAIFEKIEKDVDKAFIEALRKLEE